MIETIGSIWTDRIYVNYTLNQRAWINILRKKPNTMESITTTQREAEYE